MSKFKDLTGRSLELASRYSIPIFVKELFEVEALNRFEYSLLNSNRPNAKITTTVVYRSDKDLFELKAWRWNYSNMSNGVVMSIPISIDVAKLMVNEHVYETSLITDQEYESVVKGPATTAIAKSRQDNSTSLTK